MYDPNLLVEDRDFYLRCLAINCLRFVPDVVAKYRVHSDNASRKSLAARANIWYQVALSNVKNAHLYHGIERCFLMSHKLDLVTLSISRSSLMLTFVFILRVMRKYTFSVLSRLQVQSIFKLSHLNYIIKGGGGCISFCFSALCLQ